MLALSFVPELEAAVFLQSLHGQLITLLKCIVTFQEKPNDLHKGGQ